MHNSEIEDYKKPEFFSEYCRKLDSFKLTEDFKEDSEDDTSYTGTIEAINTLHPLVITIVIPKTFPHHKLLFWTSSLQGYPHLIYNVEYEKSWFCLNTPFAETADEQLNQEFGRLLEWIERQMREDLPAIISDPKVINSLRQANAYEWENFDEMNEYSRDSMLTFVGDYGRHTSDFKDNYGYLNCIRNESNRMYVLRDNTLTTYKLPYIIVDQIPNDLEEFYAIKAQFKWNDEICNHLLPGFDTTIIVTKLWNSVSNKEYTESEAYEKLDNALGELIIPEFHKTILYEEVDGLKSKIANEHGFNKKTDSDFLIDSDFLNKLRGYSLEDDPDAYWEAQRNEYEIEKHFYGAHYFALGIKLNEGKLLWILQKTNRQLFENKQFIYDLGLQTSTLGEKRSLRLFREIAQFVEEKEFFGRGKLSTNITNKRIAIFGAGTIGSILAETLVRSGAKKIDLWDNDIVEPGNICRSTYDLRDLGNSKVDALKSKLLEISPFIKITSHGIWHVNQINGLKNYRNGDFYGKINYKSYSETLNHLSNYDIVFDCTASNELLHFLSFSSIKNHIISLCITNHASDLLCISSKDGNPFELRKLYLSKIEQDTKNLYCEGIGCYEPTFYAKNCDIASLVHLAIREINKSLESDQEAHTTIWSHNKRGVIADRLINYELKNNSSIRLSVSTETLYDGEDIEDTIELTIGYILGGYSKDGKHIMISHFCAASTAEKNLIDAFKTSNGIIDYIGDFTYSIDDNNENRKILETIIANKAENTEINTNNPLLAMRNLDRSISFYLYLNGAFQKFIEV